MIQHFEGVVLGAAVGDAMGYQVEFDSLAMIRARFGPNGVRGFEPVFRDGVAVALFSDDTQLAVAVLRGLTEASMLEGLGPVQAKMQAMQSISIRLQEWVVNPEGGHRAPGLACLQGCHAMRQGVAWQDAGGPNAMGCGSVMRSYPFGMFYPTEKAAELAALHSRMTHAHPYAIASCAAMAAGTAAALSGLYGPREVVDIMVTQATRFSEDVGAFLAYVAKLSLEGADRASMLDTLRGWTAHEAIAAAVFIFLRHPTNFRAAVLEAANTAGDSDSIATLVGALLGARLGVGAIPHDWVKTLERSGELRLLARSAYAASLGGT